MELSFAQVENILKTLPISYYVKRKLDVELSATSNGSYCDIMNDKIVISFQQLQEGATKLVETDNIEDDIRCLLYHETSHAYLTPLKLDNSRIVNIFEDERIESLLRTYYKRVNFREFVIRMNDFHNEEPKSIDDMYYQIVRYRVGPQFLVDMVSDIIIKHKHLDRNCENYWGDVYSYREDIYELYRQVENYFNMTMKERAMAEKRKSTEPSFDDATIKETIDKMSDDEIQKLLNDSKQDEQSDEQIKNEELADDIGSILEKISNRYYSKEIFDDVNAILSSVKNSTKQNSSAINAYSGIFNPRSVVRDDFKYFVQQNRIGHVKAFSKIHLNLFIDCSGSFQKNDEITNKLLYALIRFEKTNPNFSFDLISCGYWNKLRAKNDRCQKSSGGNRLTKDIFEIFKKVQLPQQHNINIALFDGDAFSDFYNKREEYEAWKNWAAFNTANTTIISDYDNYDSINKYVKVAKTIFTRNYVAELYKNVISTLQILCKN